MEMLDFPLLILLIPIVLVLIAGVLGLVIIGIATVSQILDCLLEDGVNDYRL